MAKKRVHEIAKSQGMTSKEVLAKLQAAGLEVKAAASSVEEADALKVLNGNGAAPAAEKPAPKPAAAPKADGQAAAKPAAATTPQAAAPAKPAAAPTPPPAPQAAPRQPQQQQPQQPQQPQN